MDRLEPEGALEHRDQPVAGRQRLILRRRMLGTALFAFPSEFQRHQLLLTYIRPAAEDTKIIVPHPWSLAPGPFSAEARAPSGGMTCASRAGLSARASA